jgi:hypothetical protein
MSGEGHAIAAFLALDRAFTGRLAIKKFLISLGAIVAIICGAIYVVLSPPRPVIKEVEQKPAKKIVLPYEQQLAKSHDQAVPEADSSEPAGPQAQSDAAKAATPALQPDKQTAVEPSAQPEGGNAGTEQGAGETGGAVPPAEDANADNGTAMTPDDGANPSEQAAVPDEGTAPGQRPYDVTAVPPGATPPSPYGAPPAYTPPPPPYARSPRDGLYTGRLQPDPYGAPPPPDAYGAPSPYGAPPPSAYGNTPQGPYGNGPYGQGGGPYGQGGNGAYGQGSAAAPQVVPGRPGATQSGALQEEWVVVLVSGAGMRATASEDAPVLFAFPYGRNLKVVEHNGDWVEVTDAKSSATGWMKNDEVSPIAPPGAGPPPTEAYQQPQEEQGGWFRRRRGGLADIIGRALGGF